MAIIRNIEEKDKITIKQICEKSFKLTSLNIDKKIKQNGGLYFFNHYVEVALSKYPSQCFVYEQNKNVAGFIIYGVDNSTSIALRKKIGSIILVAVAEKHQDKKIGQSLIKYVLDIFSKMHFDLITVGTDSNNTAALSIYQNLGFKTVLNWITLRLHKPYKNKSYNTDIKLKLEKDKHEIDSIMTKTSCIKTNSYFYDRNISTVKMKNKMKKSTVKDVENNMVLFYKVYLKSTIIGFVILRHDIYLSKHTESVFQRIEDIHILPKLDESIIIFKNIIRCILNNNAFNIIEMLVPLNRYNLINAAISEEFSYTHSATILHHWKK